MQIGERNLMVLLMFGVIVFVGLFATACYFALQSLGVGISRDMI